MTSGDEEDVAADAVSHLLPVFFICSIVVAFSAVESIVLKRFKSKGPTLSTDALPALLIHIHSITHIQLIKLLNRCLTF